jgi:histidinol dehydrogenase
MLELIDGRDQLTPVHIPRPRPVASGGDPGAVVDDIIDAVRHRGDAALIELTQRFDGADLSRTGIRVEPEVIAKARGLVRPELIDALEVMSERLRVTCERQLPATWTDRTGDSMVGELIRPLRRAGVYVPGGRAAYPSSVVMAVVPARVAGVDAIAVVSPPSARGEIAEPVLAACAIAGVDEVYRLGGAQAIAALAYGTETVRPVDKIVGPGNVFVTLAKRKVQGWCGIDSEAGPTEILIIADDSADPEVVALDLIAQAEHGPNGTHALVTWDEDLAKAVLERIELALAAHKNAEDVENALIEGGRVVLVRDAEHALQTANAFAPEHLQLQFTGATEVLDAILNAGSVFVGAYSPVPVGDYVGGTNHILPTGGTARWASGLGVTDFVKRIYVSSFERSALERLAPHIEALAETEGLDGHAAAVRARLDNS